MGRILEPYEQELKTSPRPRAAKYLTFSLIIKLGILIPALKDFYED